MAEAYRSQTAAPVCPHTVSEVWAMFLQERSISLCLWHRAGLFRWQFALRLAPLG